MLKQDLHIHTTFSSDDSAVVPEQTIEQVAFVRHAKIIGISDHFESFMPHTYEVYVQKIRSHGFKLGTEINGHKYVPMATEFNFDYFIYHCWGHELKDYKAIDELLATGKPIIIAHPNAVGTDLNLVPEDCYVEINNRYIWRYNWRKEITPYKDKFKWVISSDAHQPNWLNQNIALRVANELNIKETILF